MITNEIKLILLDNVTLSVDRKKLVLDFWPIFILF